MTAPVNVQDGKRTNNSDERQRATPRKNNKPKRKFENTAQNTQMSSRLSELFKISQRNENPHRATQQNVATRMLPHLNQKGVDGVDHINFFSNPATELGALLTTENRLPFTLSGKTESGDVVGSEPDPVFESIKCLWAFYRTGCIHPDFQKVPDYKIRKLYGVINGFPKQESIFAIQALAYYQKAKAYPELGEAIANCKLNFEYYSVRDGIKARIPVSKLMINVMNEVRTALRAKRLPRLESFLSKEDQEAYNKVLPEHREAYLHEILLAPSNFTKKYKDGISMMSLEDVEKLSIDFTPPVKNTLTPAAEKMAEKVIQEMSTLTEGGEKTEEGQVGSSASENIDTELDIQSVSESVILDEVSTASETKAE